MQRAVEARASAEEVDVLYLQAVSAYSKQCYSRTARLGDVSYLAHAYPLHGDERACDNECGWPGAGCEIAISMTRHTRQASRKKDKGR